MEMFYIVIYTVLGLVIYHSLFDVWYFNIGKGIVRELVGAFAFAAVMTGLTLKFWWIALIIIILVGIGLAAKVHNPIGKKIVIGVIGVIAIMTAITGINFNKQGNGKEELKVEQNVAESEDYGNHESGDYGYYEDEYYENGAANFEEESYSGYDEEENEVGSEDGRIIEDDELSQTYEEEDEVEVEDDSVKEKEEEGEGDFVKEKEEEDKGDFVKEKEEEGEGDFVKEKEDEDEGDFVKEKEETSQTYDEEEMEQDFMDDYGEYIIPDSASRKLTESDLNGLSAQELTYARNEIYARHGYIFNSSELNEYFGSKSWYLADESFKGPLKGVEKKNAKYILEYQNKNGLEYKPQ